MTALRRALAAIGAVTLLIALSPVASAQAPRPPAPARFVAPTPGQGQVLTTSNTTIHAFVASVPEQKLFVTVAGPATVPPKEVTAKSTCQEVSVPVTLSHNGSYQVTVTADVPTPLPVDPQCQGGTAAPRQFFVAAPPRAPGGVKASMDPARSVSVSWAKNPEPDLVSYRVQRSVGAGPFQQVGEVQGTSFKDGAVPPGGPFRYQVLAVRRGKTPTETVVSPPSAAVTVGGGATGRRGGKGFGGRLFDNEPVSSAPPQPGAGGAAAASEEGFDERLPYTAGEEEAPRELGVNETSNSTHRSLAFIAGGLLVLAVYMHLWWLKRQAEQPLSA